MQTGQDCDPSPRTNAHIIPDDATYFTDLVASIYSHFTIYALCKEEYDKQETKQ